MPGFLIGLECLSALGIHFEKLRRNHDDPGRQLSALRTGAGFVVIRHGGQLLEYTMVFAFVIVNRHKNLLLRVCGYLFIRSKGHIDGPIQFFLRPIGIGFDIKFKDIRG